MEVEWGRVEEGGGRVEVEWRRVEEIGGEWR